MTTLTAPEYLTRSEINLHLDALNSRITHEHERTDKQLNFFMKKFLYIIIIIFFYTSICHAEWWNNTNIDTNKITIKEWQETTLKNRIQICSIIIMNTYQNHTLCEELENFLSSVQIKLNPNNIYLRLLAFTLKAIIEDKIIRNKSIDLNLNINTATLIAMQYLKWLKQSSLNSKININTKKNISSSHSSHSSSKWYIGGTLHKAIIKEWKKATYENKLATCADFIAEGIKNNIFITSINVYTLKYYSQELVDFINASTKEHNLLDNYKISEVVTLGVFMMKWIK